MKRLVKVSTTLTAVLGLSIGVPSAFADSLPINERDFSPFQKQLVAICDNKLNLFHPKIPNLDWTFYEIEDSSTPYARFTSYNFLGSVSVYPYEMPDGKERYISVYCFVSERLRDNKYEVILEVTTQDHLDIAVSSTLVLMSQWRQDINDDLILIHDRSSAMAKQKKIWDAIVDPNLRPIEVGYDRRKTKFPISVIKTCSEDSKSWAGLQLVDILAGAFTRCARWLTEGKSNEDLFGKRLTELISENFECFPIAPEPKFTPEQLGTTGNNAVSPHDFFVSIFVQNPEILGDERNIISQH